MTVSSLLISFSDFKWVHWVVLGVAALILLIVFIVGCKKGFSNMSLRPVSWMFGCGLFIVLDYFLHDKCFITDIVAIENPSMASFASSMTWLVIALLARWIVFGLIYRFMKWSKNAKLKKAERNDVKEKETGEEILPDENKKYKALPINGKIKPGPLNRLFGGIFMMLNTAVVLATVLSLAMVILSVTPLYGKLEMLYTGDMEAIWTYVRIYALDVAMLAIFCAIIIKGYKEGLLNGVRTLGITLAKIAVVVFGLALPFLPMAAEGGALGFLSVGATSLAELIPLPEMIPVNIVAIVIKVVFGIVIAVVGFFLVKLIGWLLGKLLDFVDRVQALWMIDGIIGAIVYAAIAFVVVVVIAIVLYTLEHYNVFMASELFSSKSPIMGGLFDLCDWKIRPLLEQISQFFVK